MGASQNRDLSVVCSERCRRFTRLHAVSAIPEWEWPKAERVPLLDAGGNRPVRICMESHFWSAMWSLPQQVRFQASTPIVLRRFAPLLASKSTVTPTGRFQTSLKH